MKVDFKAAASGVVSDEHLRSRNGGVRRHGQHACVREPVQLRFDNQRRELRWFSSGRGRAPMPVGGRFHPILSPPMEGVDAGPRVPGVQLPLCSGLTSTWTLHPAVDDHRG